jgi:hypothetical protein
MSHATTDSFEQMIRDAGEGWLIDWHAPKTDTHLRELLGRADEQARRRLATNAPRLTPEDLVREYRRNPHKVRAFLQILSSVASPDILVMAWRILEGMAVAEIRMEYEAESKFRLYVKLAPPPGETASEEYESTDIDDAVVLRHLGIMKIDGRPLFDGFYALS